MDKPINMINLGVVMVDLVGLTIAEKERKLLKQPEVGGVILFARNFKSKSQITKLCNEIHNIRLPKLLIAVDQEGGRVQRFHTDFTRIPPMKKLGNLYDTDQSLAMQCATNIGWLMANELRQVGVDFSFAPILDIDIGLSEVIGDRAFHHTAQGVSDLAKSWVDGMHQAGMCATGKHFPGHGSTIADSHIAIPVDDREFDKIATHDLIPFKVVNNLDAIMPAHVYYPKLDADYSAGFSKFWLQNILRNKIGFDGVIFSDDLSMHAASTIGDFTTRATIALEAGCDMVLVCNDLTAAENVVNGLKGYQNIDKQNRLLKMQGGACQIDLTQQAKKSLLRLEQ